MMRFFQSIATFLDKFALGSLFVSNQSPLSIAQKALKKWHEPTTALTQLLKVKNPPLPTLQAACIIWGHIPASRPEEHILTLRDLLQRLPPQTRAETLMHANGNEFTRIASLLISLAPFLLTGFEALAAAITYEWDQQRRNDDLALSFFHISAAYGVPPLQAVGSQVRILVERGQYDRAEALLLEAFARTSPPPADLCWCFLSLEQQLMRPPLRQIEVLQYFVQQYPADRRLGQAWQKIGDLYGNILEDYQKALAAYVKAEQQGMRQPQLQAYRSGNWSAIPALRKHRDYAFPPIVAVDLEVDPQPGAPHGSRVFEVAVVRYKGQTCLEAYSSYIRRDFRPKKWSADIAASRLSGAPPVDAVAGALRQFIGTSIVVGHNLRAFDAPELEGMGVPIAQKQMIDTLILARLLHPDSTRHHLALLCQTYNVPVDQATLHSALPDAQACAGLLHALGNSLAQREATLLAGIRALVTPNSAFDRAILQPRNIPADPTLTWELDPAPAPPRIVARVRDNQASPAMQGALRTKGDQLIEHTDFDARYTHALPTGERTLVTVGTHTRIERILAGHPQLQRIFVLPHSHTLLCPVRLRRAIEASSASEQRLHLFCLYQASHNHDAATLYPLRLPLEALDTPELITLRQTLLEACCTSDVGHAADCPARKAAQAATGAYPLLLSTHEALLRQPAPPPAVTIVIDDTADLQMHLAEYSAVALKSSQLRTWLRSPEEREALAQFEEHLQGWARQYLQEPVYHERLPFTSLFAYTAHGAAGDREPVLAGLRQAGKSGESVARLLEGLYSKATQKPPSPAHLHAFWVDLWFDQSGPTTQLQDWRICGLSRDLRETFHHSFWKPYARHLVTGPTLTTGGGNTRFLERSLGIPGNLPRQQDPRPRKRVLLPSPEVLPPAGFLQRRKWIIQVGALLAWAVRGERRSILVTFNNKTAAEAFIQAFHGTGETSGRQLLATQLHWTTTKINERMNDPARRLLVFASPRLRQALLDGAVDLEVSGPLRFLNKRDPLVIAQMHVFAHLYPDEGPFNAYLLPQALLELKSRLASEANEHLICDGGLLTKSYRDEVLQLLYESAEVQELASPGNPVISGRFLEALHAILAQYGLQHQVSISDADLHLILRSTWETDTFRSFPPLEGDCRPAISQKDIVRSVLERKDQLVIAATGGGKSLCFQLPAIILAEETLPKVTLVFSPLIALMSNQVEQLNRKGIFSAIMLNSTLSVQQRQEHLEGLKKGVYSIVYLAPEQMYSAKLRDVLRHREIGLIAIDEAHCLSQWGHNFRTDYFAIKKWIDTTLCYNQKREFPILALTATARKGYKDPRDVALSDQASTVTDIIEKLGLCLSEDEVVLSSAIRPELEFHFAYITPTRLCPRCNHTYEYQIEIGTCPQCGFRARTQRREVHQTVTELKKQRLLSLLSPDSQKDDTRLPDLYPRWSQPLGKRQRGLICCAYQRTTEEIADFLKQHIPGLRVRAYHAGLDNAERDELLRCFTDDTEQGVDVIACTNAFGMGIDVRRLGFVIHFDTPATPEAYYQEAGRAGRDDMFGEGRERAQCILLFHPSDLEKQRFLSSQNVFSDYEIEDVYQAICGMYERNSEYSLQSGEQDQHPSLSTGNALQVFASAQEIAEHAGVREEHVTTLLYYLEYHTTDTVNHRAVLERGALASNIWRLKFEKDAQLRLLELPRSSPSWRLAEIFQTSEEHRLTDEQFTAISARELADSLQMPLKSVEAELLNLVRRGIICYAGSGQFKLSYPLDRLYAMLARLERDLKNLFLAIKTARSGAFERNEPVTVNMRALASQHNINTVTLPQLTRFLFRHATESSEPFRLLEHFHRVTRHGQPDSYELQRWLERDPATTTVGTIEAIITQLVRTLKLLASRMRNQEDYGDWYAIDLFEPDFDYTYAERRKFHRQLLLLETLGLLKYISDPALGQAMRATLLQPPVPVELLEIDLQSLRLQERHAKSKRKLMEQYAASGQKELYAQQFSLYFQGKEPLLEHGSGELRRDLTPQQRQIATLQEGIHVIQGPAGCGKTTTLVEHVKHLVNQRVPLDHIMITTHYTSAEGHIAEALKDLAIEGATAISTTINAFGAKIFAQYRPLLRKRDGIPYYGHAQAPRLLRERNDSEEELSYINQALKRIAMLDVADHVHRHGWPWPQGVEFPNFAQDYRSNAAEEDRFQAAIHRFRQHGVFPTTPPTREELLHIVGEQTGVYSLAEFYAVYLIFIEIMAEQNLYTYDDQIVFALAILRTNPAILREYQRYYEHIIIDELQDFSPAKIELLMLLCEKRSNIMAFGDSYQEVLFDRIKTRGNGSTQNVKVTAETVFTRLSRQEQCGPGRIHHLNINFRSTQEILDLASYIRSRAGDTTSMHLQSAQNKHGQKPTYLYTRLSTLTDMLDATLDQVERLSAAEKESIALIFGSKDMLHAAQNMLRQRNIAFSLMDGQKTLYQLHYVKNLLLYLSLISDERSDDDTERLLRYNIVPYFDRSQMNSLKDLANKRGTSLFEIIASPKHMQGAKISRVQTESLQRHMDIIIRRKPDDLVDLLEQELRALSDGPITLLQDQAEKLDSVESILNEFRRATIREAVEEIRRHITFLDKHRGCSDVVLATVDYSKSQEFETVFLLGVDKVFGKRLYVSISRAKQRLFLVGDVTAFANNKTLSQAAEKFPSRLSKVRSVTKLLQSSYIGNEVIPAVKLIEKHSETSKPG